MPADRTLELGVLFTARANSAFTQNLRRLRSALMDLNNLMGKVEKTTRGVAKTTEQASKAQDKLAKSLKKTDDATKAQTKSVSKLNMAWNSMIRSLKTVATYGAAGAVLFGFTNALRAGTQEIIEFDQALKNLQAISGATDAEIAVMGDTLERIATVTKFSTTELGKGMVLLTQAGFSASEAINSMDAVATLATGTLSSLEMTTDLLTTTVRAFNLDAVESTRVSDVMANAINKSKLTIDKLRIAFNFVGATAAQANISLEETGAAMMTLANNGLRASTIGTGLRQVISRLLSPSRKLREAYEEYGIELDKISPATNGFSTAIANLAPLLMGTEKGTVDMAKAFRLFGLRGAQAAAILIKSYMSGDYENMLSKVREVGTAEAMAAKQAEGLQLQLKRLQDRAKVLALAIGKGGLRDVMMAFVRAISETVLWIGKLANEEVSIAIMQFTAWTTAIALALKGLTALTVFIVVSFLPALEKIAVLLLTNPFVAVAAGLSLVGVAAFKYTDRFKDAKEETQKMGVELENLQNLLSVYGKILDDLNEKRGKDKQSNDQYIVTLKRFYTELEKLREKYPDFISQIDIAATSHDKLAESIAKVQAQVQEQNFEASLKTLDSFIQEVERLRSPRTAEEHAKEIQAMEAHITKTALMLASAVHEGTMSIGFIEDNLIRFDDLVKKSGDVGAKMMMKVRTFLNNIKKSVKDIKEIKPVIKDLPDAFRKISESLKPKDLELFAQTVKNMEVDIASFKKNAIAAELDAGKVAAGIAQIVAKNVKEFTEKSTEEEREAAKTSLKIFKNRLKEREKLRKKEEREQDKASKAGLKVLWKSYKEQEKMLKRYMREDEKHTALLLANYVEYIEDKSKWDQEYWDGREKLLRLAINKEARAMRDADALDSEIADMKRRRWEDFYDEQTEAVGNWADGFALAYDRMREDMDSWAQQGIKNAEDLARNLESALGDSFYDMFTGNIKDLGDVWENFTKSMLSSFTASLGKMASNWILFGEATGGAGGTSVSGGGGILGSLVGGIKNNVVGNILTPITDGIKGVLGGITSGITSALGFGTSTAATSATLAGMGLGGAGGAGAIAGGAGGLLAGGGGIMAALGPIGIAAGLGLLVSSLLGDDTQEFTLDEWNKQLDDALKYKPGRGIEPHDIRHGPGGNEWYQPIADSYLEGIEALTTRFNSDVLAIVDALPEQYREGFENLLAQSDFTVDEIAQGTYDAENAQEVITSMLEQYGDKLSNAFFEAAQGELGDFILGGGTYGGFLPTEFLEGLSIDTEEELARSLESVLKVTAAFDQYIEQATEEYRRSIEQAMESAIAANQQAVESYKRLANATASMADAIVDTIRALQYSDLNPAATPASRYAMAQTDYNAFLSAAMGGDIGAAGDLRSFASTYLGYAKDIQAAPAYAATFDKVSADLLKVKDVMDAQTVSYNAQIDRLNADLQMRLQELRLELEKIDETVMAQFTAMIEQIDLSNETSADKIVAALEQIDFTPTINVNVPFGRGYASGGIINEAVSGITASGKAISIAEDEPEVITPLSKFRDLISNGISGISVPSFSHANMVPEIPAPIVYTNVKFMLGAEDLTDRIKVVVDESYVDAQRSGLTTSRRFIR